ncbi:MAG: signal peptidase I [Candidatus Spyradocola sp.]|jgi:signal peptidase I
MPSRMERRQERARRRRREACAWTVEILVVFVLAVLVRTFVFSMTTIQGPSMRETLHSGQIVAVDKLYFVLHEFSRGQIVICRYPNSEEFYVKRIVGLPGETIEIRQGQTYIDGEPLDEAYVRYPPEEDFGPVQIGEDEVFVMGDNRANSYDSRQEGTLSREMIVGRVMAVCYPMDEARWIEAETA